MKLIRSLKNNIKSRRFIFWSFFHPDNLFKFTYANKAEKIAWEFLLKKMSSYKSICEIGCVNGRIILILKEFLKNKIYIGYDLNIFAIMIAKIINFLFCKNKNFFHCNNAVFSANENCELFVSVGTLIYLREKELRKFISLLKKNPSFKALLVHEIFINEKIIKNKTIVKNGNLNFYPISLFEKEFGENYTISVERTYYPIWEKKDRISAILNIKRI